MSVICFGGVCVPYSALIPIIVYALKWVIEKLSNAGILPKSIEERINGFLKQQSSSNVKQSSTSTFRGSCCCCSSSSSSSSSAEPIVMIETEEEWEKLFANKKIVICKFTADWCGPCKKIQPDFEALAAAQADNNDVQFCVVDVDNDDLAEIVGNLGVAVLPTFCVLQESGKAKEKYVGSDVTKMKELVRSSLESKKVK